MIQLITSFEDFKATAKAISQVTRLDLKEVQKSLSGLEKMGFVRKIELESTQESLWQSQMKHFKMTHAESSEPIRVFHQETTKEALEQLHVLDLTKKFR